MKLIKITYIVLFTIIALDAYALTPVQIIDNVKQKVLNKNSEDLANKENNNIKDFINSINNLTDAQKVKLAEFRAEQIYYLDVLVRKYELLPKEVQTLLKEEKKLRSTISAKGQDDLNNYIKEATKK